MSAVRIEFDYDPAVARSNLWNSGIGGGGGHGRVRRYPMLDIMLIPFPHQTNDLMEIGQAKRSLIIAPDASFRVTHY